MRLSVVKLAAVLIGQSADAHARILTGRVIELSDQAVVKASIGIRERHVG